MELDDLLAMKPDAWACDTCGHGPVEFLALPKTGMVKLREGPGGGPMPDIPMFCSLHLPEGWRRIEGDDG